MQLTPTNFLIQSTRITCAVKCYQMHCLSKYIIYEIVFAHADAPTAMLERPLLLSQFHAHSAFFPSLFLRCIFFWPRSQVSCPNLSPNRTHKYPMQVKIAYTEDEDITQRSCINILLITWSPGGDNGYMVAIGTDRLQLKNHDFLAILIRWRAISMNVNKMRTIRSSNVFGATLDKFIWILLILSRL